MQLSKNDLKIIEENKSQFISFVYLDDNGCIKQFDIATKNISQGGKFFNHTKHFFKTIEGKSFVNPFRALATTSFFCENIASTKNLRSKATTSLKNATLPKDLLIMIGIGFQIDDPEDFAHEAVDKYAPLRSDIMLTLENLGIKTDIHYYCSRLQASIIGISGQNIIDLVDNFFIAKFIIANITDSYGLSAQFKPMSNFSLLIKTNNENYLSLLNKKLNNNISDSLKIREIASYKNNKDTIINITLEEGNIHKLYSDLTELVSHT
jgi:hypothetical protein